MISSLRLYPEFPPLFKPTLASLFLPTRYNSASRKREDNPDPSPCRYTMLYTFHAPSLPKTIGDD